MRRLLAQSRGYRQYMKDRDKEVGLKEAKDWVDRLSIKMDLD